MSDVELRVTEVSDKQVADFRPEMDEDAWTESSEGSSGQHWNATDSEDEFVDAMEPPLSTGFVQEGSGPPLSGVYVDALEATVEQVIEAMETTLSERGRQSTIVEEAGAMEVEVAAGVEATVEDADNPASEVVLEQDKAHEENEVVEEIATETVAEKDEPVVEAASDMPADAEEPASMEADNTVVEAAVGNAVEAEGLGAGEVIPETEPGTEAAVGEETVVHADADAGKQVAEAEESVIGEAQDQSEQTNAEDDATTKESKAGPTEEACTGELTSTGTDNTTSDEIDSPVDEVAVDDQADEVLLNENATDAVADETEEADIDFAVENADNETIDPVVEELLAIAVDEVALEEDAAIESAANEEVATIDEPVELASEEYMTKSAGEVTEKYAAEEEGTDFETVAKIVDEVVAAAVAEDSTSADNDQAETVAHDTTPNEICADASSNVKITEQSSEDGAEKFEEIAVGDIAKTEAVVDEQSALEETTATVLDQDEPEVVSEASKLEDGAAAEVGESVAVEEAIPEDDVVVECSRDEFAESNAEKSSTVETVHEDEVVAEDGAIEEVFEVNLASDNAIAAKDTTEIVAEDYGLSTDDADAAGSETSPASSVSENTEQTNGEESKVSNAVLPEAVVAEILEECVAEVENAMEEAAVEVGVTENTSDSEVAVEEADVVQAVVEELTAAVETASVETGPKPVAEESTIVIEEADTSGSVEENAPFDEQADRPEPEQDPADVEDGVVDAQSVAVSGGILPDEEALTDNAAAITVLEAAAKEVAIRSVKSSDDVLADISATESAQMAVTMSTASLAFPPITHSTDNSDAIPESTPVQRWTYQIFGFTIENRVVLYHIHKTDRRTGIRESPILKRYSDFRELEAQLLSSSSPLVGKLPRLPKPNVGTFIRGRRSKKTIEIREKAFKSMLKYIAMYPELHSSAIFERFLEKNRDTHTGWM